MYLSHLVAGLAEPPRLRVETTPWTEADWEVQQHLDDLEAAAATQIGEPPWCGCSACQESGGYGGCNQPCGGDH